MQLNLSQQPAIMRLQARLHSQMTEGKEIPAQATASIEDQVSALREAAKGKTMLVVLDE